jgi:MYXO-CTERM domain-containing protein
MRSLPKFLGLAVTAGLMALGWSHQARAQAGCGDVNCCDDIDCTDKGGNFCGGLVCSWGSIPHQCVAATGAANEGWCALDTDCKCSGATCGYPASPHCSYTTPPDGGPTPCNVDSECGSCGMVCSYTENPDGGTVCVQADGGDVGHCDSKIGKATCGCKDQICLAASDTCSPPFDLLDAGPNPCNVDSECGACGTVCYHSGTGHECLGQVDAGLAGGFCLQNSDCACNGQTCDTATNFCNFPDAGPLPDSGPVDAGPPGPDAGPFVPCQVDHDCTSLGNGGCGFVCGHSVAPYHCIYASTGDLGFCNGDADCLTCGSNTQTCDPLAHHCTPPQYVPDAGPLPDSGTVTDSGVADSGATPDSGSVKTCTVDADCGALDEVCSHASVPYHCVLASTGDPGYCTTLSSGANPCPAQGQTCISNKCEPPYGYDAGPGDAGNTSSSGCSTPARGGPEVGALLLALGLAGLAVRRRRRLE